MADPPNITSQAVLIDPNAGATVRPHSTLAFTEAEPPDDTRRVTPDATGFYEQEPASPGAGCPRILQLNQAGRALVGWFSPPAMTDEGDFPIRCAVLVAQLDPSGQGPYPFWYQTAVSIKGLDADAVLDPYDPWPMDGESPVPKGFIDIQPAQDSWSEPGQKLSVKLTFNQADGTPLPTLRFAHRSLEARPSERLLEALPDALSLKQALIARHRRRIATSFFDTSSPSGQRWLAARSLFEDSGPLATLLREYQKVKDAGGNVDFLHLTDGGAFAQMSGVPSASARSMLLQDMATLIDSTCAWDQPHEQFLDMLLLRNMRLNKLTIGTETRTYREWLASVVADPTTAGYPAKFDRFMAGLKVYRYVLTFSELKGGKDFGEFLHAAAFGFTVTIDAQSADACHGGVSPKDEDYTSIISDPSMRPTYVGMFFEVKGGLEGPPEIPDSVKLPAADLIPDTAFNGAYFELYSMDASVGVQVAAVNPVMNIGGEGTMAGTSMLVRLHVDKYVLEGPCEKGNLKPDLQYVHSVGIDKDKLRKIFSSRGLSKPSDFIDIPKKAGDFVKVSAGASVGLGAIGYQTKLGWWMKPSPPLRTVPAQVSGGDGRSVTTCFDRNSASFLSDVNGWEPRFLFELLLAIELALFNGAPQIDVIGSASPEYTPAHNLGLSWERARQIGRAIVDALGPQYADMVQSKGVGDLLAVSVGKLKEPDPEDDLSAEERDSRRAAVSEAERAKWPAFRKADLSIRGNLTVRVFTNAESDVALNDNNSG